VHNSEALAMNAAQTVPSRQIERHGSGAMSVASPMFCRTTRQVITRKPSLGQGGNVQATISRLEAAACATEISSPSPSAVRCESTSSVVGMKYASSIPKPQQAHSPQDHPTSQRNDSFREQLVAKSCTWPVNGFTPPSILHAMSREVRSCSPAPSQRTPLGACVMQDDKDHSPNVEVGSASARAESRCSGGSDAVSMALDAAFSQVLSEGVQRCIREAAVSGRSSDSPEFLQSVATLFFDRSYELARVARELCEAAGVDCHHHEAEVSGMERAGKHESTRTTSFSATLKHLDIIRAGKKHEAKEETCNM
jgi:hypothetical protein